MQQNVPRMGLKSVQWLGLLSGALLGGCLLATLAETWRWWRLWRPRENLEGRATSLTNNAGTNQHHKPLLPSETQSEPRKAILWLSGVSDYGNSEWLPEQQAFVARLGRECSGSVVLRGNLPADGETDARYRHGDVWRRLGFARPPLWAWGLHNWWQFALASVCERTYGQDVAQIMFGRLQQADLPVGSPVLIVCGSAGAQVALSAAPFLRSAGYARIYMIALGGAFASPHGLKAITRGANLVGDRDAWSKACRWIFPLQGLSRSTYRIARRDRRLWVGRSGAHGHFGTGSYLDNAHALPDGTTYAEATWKAIQRLPLWEEWKAL